MGGQYRGTAALRRVNSLRCADSMRRLVADPDFAIEHIEEGAIILVRLYPFLTTICCVNYNQLSQLPTTTYESNLGLQCSLQSEKSNLSNASIALTAAIWYR